MCSDKLNEISKHERFLRRAMLDSNLEQLDRLLADELVFVNHAGQKMTKAQDLELHQSGVLSLQSLELSDCSFVDLGSSVVVSVLVQLDGVYNSQRAGGTFRFCRVWSEQGVEQQANWKVVFAQSTQLV